MTSRKYQKAKLPQKICAFKKQSKKEFLYYFCVFRIVIEFERWDPRRMSSMAFFLIGPYWDPQVTFCSIPYVKFCTVALAGETYTRSFIDKRDFRCENIEKHHLH